MTRLYRLFLRSRASLASLALPWIVDLTVAGLFPERIGRVIVIDMLILWSETESRDAKA